MIYLLGVIAIELAVIAYWLRPVNFNKKIESFINQTFRGQAQFIEPETPEEKVDKIFHE